MSAAETLSRVTTSGVVGIVRTRDRASARERALRVIDAGLTVVEISLTTPGAVEVIAEVAAGAPDGVVVGAGTVLDLDAAREVLDAGARIVVTPAMCTEVIAAAVDADVLVVPGCLTPTEMLTAHRAGAQAVKIFPAHLWTPAALAGMLEAMPYLRCVPTGGVGAHNAEAWLRAGAVAVGVGGALTGAEDPASVVAELAHAVTAART